MTWTQFTLGRRKPRSFLLPAAFLPIGLRHPVADRLRGRLKLSRKIGRIAASSVTFRIQESYFARGPKLRGLNRGDSRHWGGSTAGSLPEAPLPWMAGL